MTLSGMRATLTGFSAVSVRATPCKRLCGKRALRYNRGLAVPSPEWLDQADFNENEGSSGNSHARQRRDLAATASSDPAATAAARGAAVALRGARKPADAVGERV